MDYVELNEQLRSMINSLIELGYKKTIIGKLLLGSSGYAPMLKFISEDKSTSTNFGVKPLTKIGNVIDHELRLVYVNKHNSAIIEEIDKMNNEFIEELRTGIVEYLDRDNFNSRKPYTFNKKRKNEFEQVLDQILSNEIFDQIDQIEDSDSSEDDEKDDENDDDIENSEK